jgi:hypothetical protein
VKLNVSTLASYPVIEADLELMDLCISGESGDLQSLQVYKSRSLEWYFPKHKSPQSDIYLSPSLYHASL